MLIVPPSKFVKKQPTIKPPTVVAIQPLALQSANLGSGVVFLYFDQNIDSSALDGSSITVNDPVTTNRMYVADEDHMGNDNYVEIQLRDVGPATGDVVVLNAGAGTGIVGVDDGGIWPGVNDVVLPFGS
jgi:hypothetical protein